MIDRDQASPSNLVRQLFLATNIGYQKAEILVEWINFSTGLSWQTEKEVSRARRLQQQDLMVSCVDTAAVKAERCAALPTAEAAGRSWSMNARPTARELSTAACRILALTAPDSSGRL